MGNITQYIDGVTGTDILGHLVFYTVSEECVEHKWAVDLLAKDFKEIGNRFPKNAPKDVDVFKRVASSAKRVKVPTQNPDIHRNVLVRHVSSMNGVTTKRIVIEDVTKSAKVLDFEQQFDVEYNDTSKRVLTRDLTGQADPLAAEVAQEIVDQYDKWRGCLNSYAIREWLRGELYAIHATTIKRGVYFVSDEHADTLAELVRFVNLLPGSSMFHTLPLVDNAKQRAMLKAAYETEMQTDVDDLMGEMADIIAQDGVVTKKGREARIQRCAELNAKMMAYQDLLNDNLSLAEARLDLLNEIMDDFLEVDVRGQKKEEEEADPEPADESDENDQVIQDMEDLLADIESDDD